MINTKQVSRYCIEDISKIENYTKAIEDKTQTWDCHHKGEILPCGNYSTYTLKKFRLYWNRPASELIFLPHSKHMSIHCENLSPEAKKNRMESIKTGESHHLFGKHHSTYTKDRIRQSSRKAPVAQYSLDGVFMARFPSTIEAYRNTGVDRRLISFCCKGKLKTAGGFIWRVV